MGIKKNLMLRITKVMRLPTGVRSSSWCSLWYRVPPAWNYLSKKSFPRTFFLLFLFPHIYLYLYYTFIHKLIHIYIHIFTALLSLTSPLRFLRV